MPWCLEEIEPKTLVEPGWRGPAAEHPALLQGAPDSPLRAHASGRVSPCGSVQEAAKDVDVDVSVSL